MHLLKKNTNFAQLSVNLNNLQTKNLELRYIINNLKLKQMNNKLRFLLLSLLAVFMGTASQAQDIYTISFNGSNSQSTDGYFSWNSAKHNFNSKFNGAEYAGISFTSGLKMESATYVNFTSTATSKVTIVQSTWSSNTINFDGTALAIASAVAGTGNCRIYTLNDVEAGAHSITRGGGESGLFYVSVEYTGETLDVLETPVITFDDETGKVTITADENTTSIVYTIDGSNPTATNGEVYEEPFTVEDGTVVKAIALGDGETYTNSEVATVEVLLAGVTVEAPVIKVVYGTFAITCETANVSLEYSLDGETWVPYTIPVTLFEDGTVYARATRGDSSAEASADVTAVSKGDATDTIVLTYEDFDVQTVNGLSTLVGKDAAEGYSISLNTTGKAWSNGGRINDNVSIKLSNGAENTLYLPEGISATRITFHSYINSVTPGRVSGWRVVSDVDTQYKDVPMGASATTEPDVRVFPLTGEETQFNFQNTGDQLCFYIVLDVLNSGSVEPVVYEEILTYSMDNENYAVKEDLEAGNGTIYFGADKREESTLAACGYGYKCDGDAAADGTSSKFALLKPSRPLQVGDVINISAYATSNGGGLSLYPTRDGEPLVSLTLSAKNAEETLTYTVKKGDGLAGLSSIYVYRIAGKSTYMTDVHIIGAKAKEDAEFITASISYAGYATLYYSDKALVVPEGVTAFTVLGVNEQQIQQGTRYEAGQTIPAGEAVVLEGAAGSYKFTIATESTAEPTPYNALKGSDEAAETTGGGKYYKLTVKKINGEDLVGFYFGAADGAAFTNGAHKAYLVVEDEAAAKYYAFAGQATGINAVSKVAVNNGAIYNLQGVRVNSENLTKGIYVVNGKKYVIK